MEYNIYEYYSLGEFCCGFLVKCELNINGVWQEGARFQPLLGRLLNKSGNNHNINFSEKEYYLDCAQRAQSYKDELKLFYGVYNFYNNVYIYYKKKLGYNDDKIRNNNKYMMYNNKYLNFKI